MYYDVPNQALLSFFNVMFLQDISKDDFPKIFFYLFVNYHAFLKDIGMVSHGLISEFSYSLPAKELSLSCYLSDNLGSKRKKRGVFMPFLQLLM